MGPTEEKETASATDLVRPISKGLLDWRPMDTAPRDATEIRVLMLDGTVFERCHWAQDLSGSEQPPFRGWFTRYSDGGSGFYEVGEPVGWLPLQSNAVLTGAGQDAKP